MLELLVVMEHLLEEEMVGMEYSHLLQEQQHIMPVAVEEERIILLHPLEEVQEAKVEVELEEQLDRIALLDVGQHLGRDWLAFAEPARLHLHV